MCMYVHIYLCFTLDTCTQGYIINLVIQCDSYVYRKWLDFVFFSFIYFVIYSALVQFSVCRITQSGNIKSTSSGVFVLLRLRFVHAWVCVFAYTQTHVYTQTHMHENYNVCFCIQFCVSQ